ncbi:hypothetical protein A0H76_2424 [Hepatospora eriocheir]|uniref:Uncharacterized protein n=1 Tax=Hepatospora eriocheir TaxID=1081669 RepID=A0A1X0QFP7_9MICR|nr:hypothetical protein A0H76_2424 [Hepatospora eriocheir]
MNKNEKTANKKVQVQKKDFEEILLEKIDIPYFKNNPAYLLRWKKYYETFNDPNILLLMYYKEIGKYYHWIYIELSEFFLSNKNYELANFVISLAINLNVYDSKVLKQQLIKIPEFTSKYSDRQLLESLNVRNFECMGLLWNIEESVNESIPVSSSFYTTSEIDKENDNETSTTLFKIPTFNFDSIPMIKSYENDYNLRTSAKISIDGCFYLIQRSFAIENFLTTKISQNTKSESETPLITDFLFTQVNQLQIPLISYLKLGISFCKFNDIYYTIHPFDIFKSFSEVLRFFKEGKHKYYYLEKILRVNIKASKIGYFLINLDHFYINDEFLFGINRFEFIEATSQTLNDLKNVLVESFPDFDYSLDLLEIYNDLCKRMQSPEYEEDFLFHKNILMK